MDLFGSSDDGASSNNKTFIPLGSPESAVATPDEIARALQIKQAVEKSPSVRNLSDFEYVQYAIAHPSHENVDMQEILRDIYTLQCFRDEYRIADTPEEGVRMYEQSTLQHPGLFLSVEYLSDSGNFITIDDWAAFFAAQVHSGANNRRILMATLYYRAQLVSSTFLAIRQGIAVLAECDGCGFHNLDAELHEAVMYEFFKPYPKRHKEILFLNSPTVVNVAHSLWKKYLTADMRSAFRLGYQIQGMEGRRIDVLFKTPTPEVARQHMLEKVRSFLELRYRNQATFRLPATTTATSGSSGTPQPHPSLGTAATADTTMTDAL